MLHRVPSSSHAIAGLPPCLSDGLTGYIYDPVSLRTSRAGCRACSAPARLPQASIVETGGPGRSPRLLWEQAEGTTIASLGHLDPAGCGNSHTAPRQPAIASDSEGWRACDIHGEARQATRGGQ